MKVIIISNLIINADSLLIQINLINVLIFLSPNMTGFFEREHTKLKWSQEWI